MYTWDISFKGITMKCIVCGTAFESRRADARFCAPSCRKKFSRGLKDVITKVSVNVSEKVVDIPANPDKRHCESCVTFESGIHWCPNKACSCWQTPEEQEADIEEHQKNCSHPKEQRYMNRCLRCMAHLMQEKRDSTVSFMKKPKPEKK